MRASSREEAEISGAAEVENHPCLSGFLLPDLPHLLDGTVCHACTQADNIIFVMSHAQIYIEPKNDTEAKVIY